MDKNDAIDVLASKDRANMPLRIQMWFCMNFTSAMLLTTQKESRYIMFE